MSLLLNVFSAQLSPEEENCADLTIAISQFGGQGSPLVGFLNFGSSLLKKVEGGVSLRIAASLPFGPGISKFMIECSAKHCHLSISIEAACEEASGVSFTSITLGVENCVEPYIEKPAITADLHLPPLQGERWPLPVQTISFWLPYVPLSTAARLYRVSRSLKTLLDRPENWGLPDALPARASRWLRFFLAKHAHRRLEFVDDANQNCPEAKHVVITDANRPSLRPLLHPLVAVAMRFKIKIPMTSVNFVLRHPLHHLFGCSSSYLKQEWIDVEIDERLFSADASTLIYHPRAILFEPIVPPIEIEYKLPAEPPVLIDQSVESR